MRDKFSFNIGFLLSAKSPIDFGGFGNSLWNVVVEVIVFGGGIGGNDGGGIGGGDIDGIRDNGVVRGGVDRDTINRASAGVKKKLRAINYAGQFGFYFFSRPYLLLHILIRPHIVIRKAHSFFNSGIACLLTFGT